MQVCIITLLRIEVQHPEAIIYSKIFDVNIDTAVEPFYTNTV